MFKVALFFALPLLALAFPPVPRGEEGSGSSSDGCSSGTISCCQDSDMVSVCCFSVHSPCLSADVWQPYSNIGSALLELSGLKDHESAYVGTVASSCDTGIGILDGSTCSGTPVCCSGEVCVSEYVLQRQHVLILPLGRSCVHRLRPHFPIIHGACGTS